MILAAFFLAAQSQPQVLHLWSNGAPGFESRKAEPEQAKDYWVKNIHNPSITVYLSPKEKATGTGVLIAPGGGHSLLVIDAEGTDPAKFLNQLGIAAFVLKYRLAREPNSPYKLNEVVPQDGYRAMRLIRSHAEEWGLDPKRIGVLGFSAGGEVASMIAYGSGDGDPNAPDPIDRLNGKPNFQMLVYPGPLGIPDTIPPNAPPTFMVVAQDDDHTPVLLSLAQKFYQAKVPFEAHFYQKGGHGFNMGCRSNLASIKGWPQRMAEWLTDQGWTNPNSTHDQ